MGAQRLQNNSMAKAVAGAKAALSNAQFAPSLEQDRDTSTNIPPY